MISGEVMTSYLFFKMAAAAILDLIWVMFDHPRSAIFGLSLILKFGIDPIYSFGGIAIFIFCRFGLKLSIQAHFGVWGIESQIWSLVTHRSEPQEGPSLRGSTSFEP